MGKKGVFVDAKSIRKHIPGYKVDTREPTGCRDIFNAAFIHGILENISIGEIAKFASAAGAYAARFLGTVNSLSTLNDIRRLPGESH